MRLLLDTHAFLWFVNGDSRLTDSALSTIEDERNEVLLSAASIWEMAIKSSIGKLRLPQPLHNFLERELRGFDVLPVTLAHAMGTAQLPMYHRDPFDRLLAAVCIVEGMPIVSADESFSAYGIQRIWTARLG